MDDQEDVEDKGINTLPSGILHGVFGELGPRDRAACSATCTLWRKLNKDRVSNSEWKKFYTSRWCVTGPAGDDVCWQTKYGSKMKQGKSWTGKYEHDSLYGHKAGVKSLKLLPSRGMLLTGSLDRTIRLWDLHYGMPVCISRPHGGTVRSVDLDTQLVASGSSDNVVRLWHGRNATAGGSGLDPAEAAAAAALLQNGGVGLAEGLMEMDGPADASDEDGMTTAAGLAAVAAAGRPVGLASLSSAAAMPSVAASRDGVPITHGPYSVVTGDADESLFDLSLPGQQLRGHIGPVTSLCLTDACLYSGSWDYTVRCWRRGSWDCISVLKYQDWVWSVVARGGMLLVASGPEVHVHDLPTGKLVRKFQNLHEGSVSCLEGTHSGKLLFTGGADGLLMAHDLRMKESSRVLWHHNAGVHGLALEDPWLVSAASDGTVIMHNTEMALPNSTGSSSSSSNLPSRRSLHCPGHAGPMYCVDIADGWLAAGGESPAVRTWDFTKAAEAAARAAAARAARSSSKRAAKLRKAAAAARGAGETGVTSAGGGDAAGKGKRGGRKGRGGGGDSSSYAAAAAGACALTAAAGAVAATADVTASSAAAAAGAATGGGSSSSGGSKAPKGLLAAAAAAAKAAEATNVKGASAANSNADRFHRMQHTSSRRQQQQGAAAGDQAAEHIASSNGNHRVQNGAFRGSCNGHRSHRQDYYGSSPQQQQWPGSYGSYSSSPQQQQWHGSYGSSPQQHWPGRYSSSPQQQQQQQQWFGSSPPSRWQPHASRAHPSSQQQQQQPPPAAGSGGSNRLHGGRDSREASGIPIPSTSGSACRMHHSYRKQAAAGAGRAAAAAAAAAAAVAVAGLSPPAAAAAAAPAGRRSCSSVVGGVDGCSEGACGELSTSPAGAAVAASCYRVPFSSSFPSAGQPAPWLASGSSPRFEVVMRHGGDRGDSSAALRQGAGGAGEGCEGGARSGLREAAGPLDEFDGPGSISN